MEKIEKLEKLKETNKSAAGVRRIAAVGVMAAVICILGPLSIPIPISPVPISFTMVGIYFAVYALGMKNGTAAYLIYMLLGLVGLPVFSGYTAGPGKLFGPTGGYIIAFIFTALIAGFFIDRYSENVLLHILGMALGMAVLYFFGSLWLAWQGKMTMWQALMAGTVPYIPADIVKIILAALIGLQLRRQLKRAGLFHE